MIYLDISPRKTYTFPNFGWIFPLEKPTTKKTARWRTVALRQTRAYFYRNSWSQISPGPGPLGQHQVGQGVVVLLLVPPERRWDQMLSHELLASWVNYGLW